MRYLLAIKEAGFKAGYDGNRLSKIPYGLSFDEQNIWIDGWIDGEWSRYAREGMKL